MPYKFNPVTGKLDYYEAGSGSADLETVLGNGNTSGPNDIQFDTTQGVLFNNSSRLREGTIDALLGGSKGIAQICAVGYELKWEAGRLYVMDGNGIYIRWSLYNFTITPTVTDDSTLGYLTGSKWSLDDGTTYVCTDNTTGAAVWEIQEYDFIGFNTAAAHSVGVGELAWNSTDGTLDLGLQGGLINRLGQQLVVKARNTSGSTITKGSVVKVVGVAGGFVGINLAQADSVANSETAFGITAEDIADTSNGFVAINGIVHNVNTNAFTEGDILYLSPTTPGEITNIKPISPDHAVVVGYVAKKSATDGHILLHVQNGYELDELHNVSITTPANNDALVYESATSLWKNKRLPTEIQLAASDETTALTAGTAKVTFRMPYGMTVTSVRASLTTAQASGSIFTVDINEGGTSILSTKLTIDNTEKTSTTAATPAVISDTALADDAEITIDIDQIGDGTAKGLKITLIGTR
jgi:hypothetical protein